MNIFNLPLEEAEKEIEKMIKSVPREQLIQDLKECGLMNKQDKKEIMNLIKYKKMLGGRKMKSKKFYVLMDKNTLSYHEESGCTTNDIEEAAHFKTASGAFHYIKTEIGDDYQKDFLVYKVDMHLNFELIEEDEI